MNFDKGGFHLGLLTNRLHSLWHMPAIGFSGPTAAETVIKNTFRIQGVVFDREIWSTVTEDFAVLVRLYM